MACPCVGPQALEAMICTITFASYVLRSDYYELKARRRAVKATLTACPKVWGPEVRPLESCQGGAGVVNASPSALVDAELS